MLQINKQNNSITKELKGFDGILKFSNDLSYKFTADDLKDHGEIGSGGYGTVNKMIHKKSNRVMAVKRIRSTVDKEGHRNLIELEVAMKSVDCPYTVQFYGALFKEGDCWICMEIMSASMEKFYTHVHNHLKKLLPVDFLGRLVVSTLKALTYLRYNLHIIHRDIKPSNILVNREGEMKLCDFGISGQLIDSLARTQDAGCRPYMAPERIDPARSMEGYGVKSDVWSLGITLYEISTGSYPYKNFQTIFDQLSEVRDGAPPRLAEGDQRFDSDFIHLVNKCLIKDQDQRPNYNNLQNEPFVKRFYDIPPDVCSYVCSIIDSMESL